MSKRNDVAKSLGYNSAEEYIIDIYPKTHKVSGIMKMLDVTEAYVLNVLSENNIPIKLPNASRNTTGIFQIDGNIEVVAGKMKELSGLYMCKDLRCVRCHKIWCKDNYITMPTAQRRAKIHYNKCKGGKE